MFLIIHLTHSRPSARGPRCHWAGGETCHPSWRPAWLKPMTATSETADWLAWNQMRDLDNQDHVCGRWPERAVHSAGHERAERRPFRHVEVRKPGPGRVTTGCVGFR